MYQFYDIFSRVNLQNSKIETIYCKGSFINEVTVMEKGVKYFVMTIQKS